MIINVKYIFQMGTIKFTEITVLFCSFFARPHIDYFATQRKLSWQTIILESVFFPRNIPAQQKLMEKNNIRGAMGKIE